MFCLAMVFSCLPFVFWAAPDETWHGASIRPDARLACAGHCRKVGLKRGKPWSAAALKRFIISGKLPIGSGRRRPI